MKLVTESGDKAEVEMAIEGKPAKKMKLVKIENRWFPEEMTTAWAEGLAEAKKSISEMEKMSNTDKELFLSKMRVVQAAIKDQIPLASFGTVDDVAAAVMFLAGEGGRYITGQTLAVDGGMVM